MWTAGNYIEGEPQVAKTAVNPDEEVSDEGEQIKGGKTEDRMISILK